jgi:DNA invertase Pin-like site-specific DNA recombinase
VFLQTKQADRGVSLEAQAEKIRAMAVVHNAELIDIIVDGGESAKSLNRHGMARLLALVDAGEVKAVIIAKLDRLTRSVKDLCTLLERFERRGVALVSVAESLDTGSAAGRLVLNILTAVSQWEREAIGERTRDAMSHKRNNGERVGNIQFGYRLCVDGKHVEPDPAAGGARNSAPAPKRCHTARNRCGAELPRASDPSRFCLAAGARGTNHQAGHNRPLNRNHPTVLPLGRVAPTLCPHSSHTNAISLENPEPDEPHHSGDTLRWQYRPEAPSPLACVQDRLPEPCGL